MSGLKTQWWALCLCLLANYASVVWAGQNYEGNQASAPPVLVGKGSLLIAGEGYWNRQMVGEGEYASVADYGPSLSDGIYQYEFRPFSPGTSASRRQREVLTGKSEPHSNALREVPPVISGSFTVQGGQVSFN